jgi:hypothetical protein
MVYIVINLTYNKFSNSETALAHMVQKHVPVTLYI